jgi:hypothetical protein
VTTDPAAAKPVTMSSSASGMIAPSPPCAVIRPVAAVARSRPSHPRR